LIRNSIECPDRRVLISERLAFGDPEHLPNEVDAGHLLGDRVLDLQPRVDLEERDRPVLPDEEFAGPRPGVSGSPEDRLRRAVKLLLLRLGQERSRCLLDQLLMAPLQRTVSGRDDDDAPVLVG
jgi:hypothetical protein